MKKIILASVLIILMVASVMTGLVGVSVTQADTISYVKAEQTYQTGDIVTFGSYWQTDTNGDGTADQNDTKEPIEWRVLSQDGDDLFLMATKGLDSQPYNITDAWLTWETCTLRTWLNDYFYNDAFSTNERKAIKTTTLENENNPWYGTEGGHVTYDKVFLLSLSDVTNASYGFLNNDSGSDTKRQIKATEYAVDRNVDVSTNDVYGGNCHWWLRSPGNSGYSVALVSWEGEVIRFGQYAFETNYAVCPALHIDLKSVNQTPAVEPTPTINPLPSVEPTEKPPEEKKTVVFTKKKVKINKGKKKVLKVKIKGANKAKFSVNKKGKKVVKLMKKKAKKVTVKGKKIGKAVITAKITGKKATCMVTVK